VMPCSGEHLIPSERERYWNETCMVAVWVFGKLGMQVPDGVARGAEHIYGPREDPVPILCAALRGLTLIQRDALLYGTPKDPMCRRAADWWEHHEAEDRKREAGW
jgi:hypothetical protein